MEQQDVRVTFVVTYNTIKLSFYTNTKDCTDKLAHSYIIHKFCCLGCSKSYIGKTETTFFERINERAFKDKNSIVCNHINNCNGVKYLADLLNIDEVHIERDKFDKIYNITTVKENISIIDRARRWAILLFKEALHIKEKKLIFNNGLKASKEVKLF